MKLSPEIFTLLKGTASFAAKKKAAVYVVGGFLRDMLLKREKENPDIDFSIAQGAIRFGRQLSRELSCGYVVLDKEHGCCRLVKKIDGSLCTLDFTDFRGPSLEDDLLHRDFTINAMAAELNTVLGSRCLDGGLIDPFGARHDLGRKLIRMVNPKAFQEDPLRMLRAFSLACTFGFKIHPQTLRCIRATAPKLSRVSFERIREELFKILESPQAGVSLTQMDRLKLLPVAFPEIAMMRGVRQGPYHHLDVWKHSLETVRQLDMLLQQLRRNKDVKEYLDEAITSTRKRRGLLKLGALLHDIGKPKALRRRDGKTIFHGHERVGVGFTRQISRRLRLSNDETQALERMVMWHLRPGYLADNAQISSRAKFRYFRDTQKEGASVLLLSLADQRATCGPLTTRESRLQHEKACLQLIKEYFRRQKEASPARLINGDQLMRSLKIPPSPLVGRILLQIEELQAIGKVKNAQQALAAARKIEKEMSALTRKRR
ncbi:MAG TPA: HD domain-containing protein [Patescibacteria group bacterium]|nr:HD domain-containing protein [Patescibacteria group bacterium]